MSRARDNAAYSLSTGNIDKRAQACLHCRSAGSAATLDGRLGSQEEDKGTCHDS